MSRAKGRRSPASAEASPTRARASGASSRASSTRSGPRSTSARTSEALSAEASPRSSTTSTRSATGFAWVSLRQKISARRTDESVSGSWPTPTKTDYGSSQNGSNSSRPSAGTPSISTRVKSCPTPMHADATPGGCRPDEPGYHRQVRDVVHNWPTPTKTDAWDSARHTTTTGVMHPGTMSLDAVRDFYSSEPTGHPAPSLPIHDGTTGSPEALVVNPAFVARLMGLPEDWLSAVPIPDSVVEKAYEKMRLEKKKEAERLGIDLTMPDDDEDDEIP